MRREFVYDLARRTATRGIPCVQIAVETRSPVK